MAGRWGPRRHGGGVIPTVGRQVGSRPCGHPARGGLCRGVEAEVCSDLTEGREIVEGVAKSGC